MRDTARARKWKALWPPKAEGRTFWLVGSPPTRPARFTRRGHSAATTAAPGVAVPRSTGRTPAQDTASPGHAAPSCRETPRGMRRAGHVAGLGAQPHAISTPCCYRARPARRKPPPHKQGSAAGARSGARLGSPFPPATPPRAPTAAVFVKGRGQQRGGPRRRALGFWVLRPSAFGGHKARTSS
jgi:hypothetical protein